MIGLGYYDTITPPVIRRNVLENPAWYTAYTPYQPEISQGRLEALLNFQTMVADLTGLATAGRLAAGRVHRGGRGDGAGTPDSRRPARARCRHFPDRRRGVRPDGGRGADPGRRARAAGAGRRPERRACRTELGQDAVFGVLLQYPGASSGVILDPRPVIEQAHERGAQVAMAADLLALTLLTPPGELGADIAVGHQPAVRGADGLRWPACRLPVDPGRPGTAAARPAGRGVHRRRRPAGVPAGVADP